MSRTRTPGHSGEITASAILQSSLGHIDNRASAYDAPTGERSMAKTVAMFNVYTDHSITEVEGWQFMELLKMVRSSQGVPKADNYEDGAAYAALAGEARLRSANNIIDRYSAQRDFESTFPNQTEIK